MQGEIQGEREREDDKCNATTSPRRGMKNLKGERCAVHDTDGTLLTLTILLYIRSLQV